MLFLSCCINVVNLSKNKLFVATYIDESCAELVITKLSISLMNMPEDVKPWGMLSDSFSEQRTTTALIQIAFGCTVCYKDVNSFGGVCSGDVTKGLHLAHRSECQHRCTPLAKDEHSKAVTSLLALVLSQRRGHGSLVRKG